MPFASALLASTNSSSSPADTTVLLGLFPKLASARDQGILAYARRWGPLWLCPGHGLPWRHDPACEPGEWEGIGYDVGLPALDEGGAGKPTTWGEVRARNKAAQAARTDTISADIFASVAAATGEADDFSDEPEDTYDEVEVERTWYAESLTAWRALSTQARATIRLARRLHDGQLGLAADWNALPFLPRIMSRLLTPALPDPFATLEDFGRWDQLLAFEARAATGDNVSSVSATLPDQVGRASADGGGEGLLPDRSSEHYVELLHALGKTRLISSSEFQRRALAEVLNYWLELTGVRPRLDWSSNKPAVQLGGDGLVGALAVQLLFDCSRTDGLTVCTSCGTPFLPGARRPRRDRNAYCPDCGIRAAARDAAARYRQTKRHQDTYRKWAEERKGEEASGPPTP